LFQVTTNFHALSSDHHLIKIGLKSGAFIGLIAGVIIAALE
jgi:tetrahydromethanopterin S-methyltransferase subunit F